MNINFRANFSFLALFLSTVTFASGVKPGLQAEQFPRPHTANYYDTPSPLEQARSRLKSASKGVKDPEILSYVATVIKRADAVIKAGPTATPEHVHKALRSVQKVLNLVTQKKALAVNSASKQATKQASTQATKKASKKHSKKHSSKHSSKKHSKKHSSKHSSKKHSNKHSSKSSCSSSKKHSSKKHSFSSRSSKSYKHHSSSKTCDARHELSELESEFEGCCNDIKRELTEVFELVGTGPACGAVIPINNVPIVLNQSGKYCVTTDLVYNGVGSAITVTADNVSINFHNHSLTLTDSTAQGILVSNVDEFTLENDIIQGSAIFKTATSAAVHLVNVNKATINNVYTKNTTKGIQVDGSTDVKIAYSEVNSHEGNIQLVFPSPATLAGTGNGGGIWINNSRGIAIDSCAFVGADLVFDATRTSFGLHIEGTSENVQVTNSTFTNWLGTIHALRVNGLLIDHCVAVASPVSSLNLVQLGNCEALNKANEVIIRNSSFIQRTPVQGFDGLLVIGGAGCLIENVVVDVVSNDIPNGYLPSAFHIGSLACDPYQNLIAKNCIVKGVNGRMVHIENGVKNTLDGCQVSGGTAANVLLTQATSCAVKNCEIINGASGVLIDPIVGAGKNYIENCLVYNHTVNGIRVNGSNNHVSSNSVWNSVVGISANIAAVNNEFYGNTSCQNTTNCQNIAPTQAPGATPAFPGTNVCCP